MESFRNKKLKIIQNTKLEQINKLIDELRKEGVVLKARNPYCELEKIEDIQIM